MNATFHIGDAADFDILAGRESLDCIVQDPPAGIDFMGASFDRDHGGRDAWIKLHARLFAAGRRACKPGAWSLLTACYRAEQGKWPNGGGWLDETAAFLRAVDWVANEKARVEKEIEANGRRARN